ncbi:GAF domain-containing SpoIIE family protein phosphatase [Spirochaeta cellobiosiphila]|uniref:GAF domain-containing SpoIIE family protein phosphatase n=1 Tax=Spirochaeta cellobiosiphila TaxID=504483 RepID=UPI0003FB67BD|nr:GAF domain-containing SpoIIE family protein phosphatase [Spirochaeta cellobiosiphila]
MIDLALSFFSSLIWVRWAVLALTYVFHRSRLDSKRDEMKGLTLLIILLVVKDFLFYIFNLYPIMAVADLLWVYALYLFLYRFTQKIVPSLKINTVINIIAVVLFILVTILDYHPMISAFIFRLIILLNVFVTMYFYNDVSPYNTENHEFIIRCRKVIFRILIAYNLVMIFFSYTNTIAMIFILPLPYLILPYILLLYEDIKTTNQQKEIESLSSNLSTIYDFMKTMGYSISEKLEISKILEFVIESAVSDTKADGGAIYLKDDFEDNLSIKSISGKFTPPFPVPDMVRTKYEYLQDYIHSTPIPIGKTLLGEVAATGKASYIRQVSLEERLVQNTKNDAMYISSLMAIPLIVSNQVFGVVVVINKHPEKLFTEDHFEHLKTFTDYTSISINNLFLYIELLEKKDMEREVTIAADIQQQLLPRELPQFRDLSLASFSYPAKGVSGDYYDIIPIRNNKLALVMCDVAGKGVPASLVMVMIRTIIHLVVGSDRNADRIITWVNRGITGRIALDRFATMSYLTYDPETHMIQYSNAAHHPLMIYRNATKQVETLDTEGIPIGLEKDSKYGLAQTKLNNGDMMILYTDGIIEAMNTKGEQFTYEKLVNLLEEYHDYSCHELLKLIKDRIDSFVGQAKQHDDQTIIIAKVDN